MTAYVPPYSPSLQDWQRQVANAVNPLFPKCQNIVDVKADYGALGDGVSDDRAAFAAAIAGARGKRLFIPEGNYVINTDGGTIIVEEVDLVGQGVLDGATGTIDQGAMLWITGTTNSPFKIRRGVSFEGLGIYYPNQTDSASPTAYPTTFVFDFTDGAVQFCTFHRNVIYNAYKLMDIDNGSTGGVGHVEITNNYICALNRGIYVRYNSEHLRIERNNFTFGHWLQATEAGARGYMRANATAIQVDQTDGIEIVDNLIFGQLNGTLWGAQGLCQFIKVSENKFDETRYGVLATGTGNFDGQVINNTFNCYNPQNTALAGRSIDIETSGASAESITIVGNNFDACTADHVYVSGTPTRELVVGTNNWRSWASFVTSGTYGALNVSGANTNLQVTGGWFQGSNSAAYSNGIMGSPNTCQVTGATFNGCLSAINATSNWFTLTGNRSFTTGATHSTTLTSGNTITSTGNAWDKP